MSIFEQGTDHDLKLTNGRLTVLTGTEETRRRLINRVRLAEGEWFLDTRVGMPYYKYILVKNPQMNILSRIFRTAIKTVPGVKEIQDFGMVLSPQRELAVSYSVLTWDGDVIQGGDLTPFIWEDRR